MEAYCCRGVAALEEHFKRLEVRGLLNRHGIDSMGLIDLISSMPFLSNQQNHTTHLRGPYALHNGNGKSIDEVRSSHAVSYDSDAPTRIL